MFIRKMYLPRRTFLQGMGATLALPLLEAMIPAATALANTAGQPVRRFGAMYVPNGMSMDFFTPKTAGPNFELSPILKPLEPFRDQLVVISGLGSGPRRTGGHALGPVPFLTGVGNPNRTEGADLRAGTTIDQVWAKRHGQDTIFPSLELATEDFTTSVGSCETGLSCAYLNTISWATPTTPLPMETNPRLVFERMFGRGSGTPEERAIRLRNRRSVLDVVAAEARRLQARLGPADRTRVDDYLTTVREIEGRIQKAEEQKASSPIPSESPVGVPDDHSEHVALMFDLLAVAFQADVTRVFTFMMLRELSNQTFPGIGINEPHHPLAHHQNRADRIERFARVNAYHVQLVANFLKKLKATPDGDGSLLDHSLFLWGGGISDGNLHSYDPLPIVLLGGDSGQLKGDRHLIMPAHTPHANLLLTLAQRGGVPGDSFGDSSTGTIEL